MINVLVLVPPFLNTVEYWRLWHPFEMISAIMPGVFKFEFKRKEINYADVWNAHVIVTTRPGSKDSISEVITKAKAKGKPVIVDIDDHLFDLPDSHDLYFSYLPGSKGYENAKNLCESADLFWFSTPAFLETYGKKFGKKSMVVPNAIHPALLPEEPAPDQGHWAWRGRSIQVHDLIYAGQHWYRKIRNKPKRWFFLGWKPPLDHADNYTPLPPVTDIEEYMDNIRKSRFNGIWKPMVECSFNNHKSNISWIEATMSGGVCLTNYAGKPGWEFATAHFPTYKEACELWQKSKTEIQEKYNLIKTAQMRAVSIIQLLPQFYHLLNTSSSTAET